MYQQHLNKSAIEYSSLRRGLNHFYGATNGFIGSTKLQLYDSYIERISDVSPDKFLALRALELLPGGILFIICSHI